jgi:serine/threonine-protein kinase
MIELRTLGHLELTADDGSDAATLVAQPKRFALLCYLAIPKPGTLHRRDTLLGLFWPEVDHEHARMDLRQALHFIRHVLGEDALLRCGDQEVGVNPDRVWCDAAEFQRAVDEGRWSDAVGLYRGEFLKGFHVSGDPEFERWLDRERSRLVRAYAGALERAVDSAVAGGDVRGAVEYCERLVEHDRYNSRYAMKLMEALVAAGDPANALLYAERHRELLRAELDIAPPPELDALTKRIRLQPETLRPLEGPQSEEDMLPQLGAPARPGGGVSPTSTTLPSAAKSGWKVAAVTGAFAAVIAVMVIVMLISREGGVSLDPERVVVAVFRNETGDVSLDLVGRLAGHWITQGIQQTGTVQVMPWETALRSWLHVQAEADSGRVLDPVRALAEETGAGTVISGAYYLEGDTIQIQAEVNDATQGRLIGSVDPVRGSRGYPSELVGQLQQRLMSLLAMRYDERLAAPFDLAGNPPTFEAYRVFDQGMERFLRNAQRDAQPYFRRAIELDSTYAEALLFLAATHWNRMEYPQADTVLRLMDSIGEKLSPYYRSYGEGLQAAVDGDLERALSAIRHAAEMAPGSRAWYTYGVVCGWTNRPHEAVRAFHALDPERGPMRGWIGYWWELSKVHLMLAEYEQVHEVAQRIRRLHPDQDARALLLEALAAAGLGRTEDLSNALQQLMSEPAPAGVRTALLDATRILQAIGMTDAARDVGRRAVAWLESRPLDEMDTAAHRYEYGWALYFTGRHREAQEIFDGLVDEYREWPYDLRHRGARGFIAAIRGDSAQAQEDLEWFANVEGPYLQGVHKAYGAVVAGALGQREAAVMLLRQGYAEGTAHVWNDMVDPQFEPLRGYEPFEEWLRPKG